MTILLMTALLGAASDLHQLPSRDDTAPASTDGRRELAQWPRGWLFGASVETDWSAPADDVGVAPALTVAYAGRWLGGALSVLGTWPLGLRAEARGYPLPRGVARPYLAVGVSAFVPYVGFRAAAGVEWQLWGPLVAVGHAAYEYYVYNDPAYRDHSVQVGLGAAYNLQ